MKQLTLDGLNLDRKYPVLEVHESLIDLPEPYRLQVDNNLLSRFTDTFEVWVSNSSSNKLSYKTHGVFRYFGKFPPPIARHLVESYSMPGEVVVDCMCGSGTTGLECMLLGRGGNLYDVNPLAILLSMVKTTKIKEADALRAVENVCREASLSKPDPSNVEVKGLKNLDHWFLPSTKQTLEAIRIAIRNYHGPDHIRNFLLVAFAAIVRKVSRATKQQGRLFLDKETAIEDAIPTFKDRGTAIASAVASLPDGPEVIVTQLSMLDDGAAEAFPPAPLIICHPPYFNNYKFSRVNSLELAWLGYVPSDIAKNEVREAFKMGKPERLPEYLADMEKVFRNLEVATNPDTIIALMIGDTIIRGEYIPVTAALLGKVLDLGFEVEKVAYRIPKGTEASWVTSQRRKSDRLGVMLCDYVIIMRRGNRG